MPEIWEVQEKPPAMSADSFEVREYQTADEAEVLTLLGQALGDGRAFARTSAFWQWKHFQNPFGPSLMMVAVSRGVLGLRAFLRWQFHVGTQTLSAIRAVDTATHPTHRRHGVFATLTHRTVERARDEGVDLIFNTPNQQSLPGYVKLGWSYVGRPPMLVRVLRPLRVARGVFRRRPQTSDPWPVVRAPVMPIAELLSKGECLKGLLVENDRLCGGFRTARSVEFLHWRYAAAPSLRYYACWSGGNAVTAAAVLRPNRRWGLREIVLCELFLSRTGLAQAACLVRDLVAAVDADYIVAHAAPGSAQAQALRRAGFIRLPRVGPNFTVRPLSRLASGFGATSLGQWELSLGDLEVF